MGPITNRQLRRMGWLSFFAGLVMAVASGFELGPSDVVIIAFLTHAAACFGLPTVRNIAEGYAPNLAGRSH